MITITDFSSVQLLNIAMGAMAETADAGALFKSYHDRIYRYIVWLVKDPAEAEDLTQETFLRVYRGGDSLRDPQAVRGWLYRIATNVCLDRLRQRKGQVSLEGSSGEEGRDQIETLSSPSPSPVEITERKETSACVQRCLDFIPDKYRAVILLREVHSLTAVEIADLLGVPVTTVKIRLHRARRMLQQVMERGCAVSRDIQGVPTCKPKL
ncbi:MAG TPA: RNA polymerase sigma factor [Terriglobales bacterium]|nr:RNA polymerase sigma factor [Terriglobales bacterium]